MREETTRCAKNIVVGERLKVQGGGKRRVVTVPNNRERSHTTAVKPRLTSQCNSPAPPAALGRRESVRRVVVCRSVARTHVVVPTRLDLHNHRAELWLCWDSPLGLMRQPLKAPKRPLRERELSSLYSPLVLRGRLPFRRLNQHRGFWFDYICG